jgi:hypothetical protein
MVDIPGTLRDDRIENATNEHNRGQMALAQQAQRFAEQRVAEDREAQLAIAQQQYERELVAAQQRDLASQRTHAAALYGANQRAASSIYSANQRIRAAQLAADQRERDSLRDDATNRLRAQRSADIASKVSTSQNMRTYVDTRTGERIKAAPITSGPLKAMGQLVMPGGQIIDPANTQFLKDITSQQELEQEAALNQSKISAKDYEAESASLYEQSTRASEDNVQLDFLSEFASVAPQGNAQEMVKTLGGFAEAFGYEANWMGAAQAAGTITENMRRDLFKEFKGSISNAEQQSLERSLPSLKMTPQGLALTVEIRRRLNDWKIKEDAYYQRAVTAGMTPQQRRVAMTKWRAQPENKPQVEGLIKKAVKVAADRKLATFASLIEGGFGSSPGSGTPAATEQDDPYSLMNQLKQQQDMVND